MTMGGLAGGAGLGSGPGMAVGAALALAGSDRLPVAVLGDGDLLTGAGALWTAARRWTARPTGTEPMNAIRRTPG